MEGSLRKYHEDHIAGKGHEFMESLQSGAQIFLIRQAMKIQMQKAAMDK